MATTRSIIEPLNSGDKTIKIFSNSVNPFTHFLYFIMADERMLSFVVGNNYKVLDVIGEGAYGIVW